MFVHSRFAHLSTYCRSLAETVPSERLVVRRAVLSLPISVEQSGVVGRDHLHHLLSCSSRVSTNVAFCLGPWVLLRVQRATDNKRPSLVVVKGVRFSAVG